MIDEPGGPDDQLPADFGPPSTLGEGLRVHPQNSGVEGSFKPEPPATPLEGSALAPTTPGGEAMNQASPYPAQRYVLPPDPAAEGHAFERSITSLGSEADLMVASARSDRLEVLKHYRRTEYEVPLGGQKVLRHADPAHIVQFYRGGRSGDGYWWELLEYIPGGALEMRNMFLGWRRIKELPVAARHLAERSRNTIQLQVRRRTRRPPINATTQQANAGVLQPRRSGNSTPVALRLGPRPRGWAALNPNPAGRVGACR